MITEGGASMSSDILLGDNGVFAIDGVAVGLTRGGGTFKTGREYKHIDADNDRGIYKGRQRLTLSKPTLELNALQIIGDEFASYYPAITNTAGTGTSALTGNEEVADADYHEVTWTGKTKGGKEVVITVFNAINLGDIDFTLADKDEIVANVVFAGSYEEASPENYEPWSVVYGTGV